MKITISSGGHDDPRTVLVEDEGMEPLSFKTDSLNDAHKKLKLGRKDGWDSLRTKKAPAAKGA